MDVCDVGAKIPFIWRVTYSKTSPIAISTNKYGKIVVLFKKTHTASKYVYGLWTR